MEKKWDVSVSENQGTIILSVEMQLNRKPILFDDGVRIS